MTYHRPPVSLVAPVGSVRRFLWGEHVRERLAQRWAASAHKIRSQAQAALIGGQAEEWWEWDRRRDRGQRRNLLVRVAHPSGERSQDAWVLWRLDERDPTLAHACTVLSNSQYQSNTTLLWSKTRGGSAGGSVGLTHRIDVRRTGRR